MRRYSTAFLLMVGAASLGGCVSHTYVAGPGMSPERLGRDEARCHIFAEGTRPGMGFEASGSPKEVAIESGVALVAGGLLTAWHDSSAYDNCMQARGYLVADGGVAQPVVAESAVPQPVTQSPLPAAGALPTDDESSDPFEGPRSEKAEHARATAQAWLIAQNILNGPESLRQHDLYVALCKGGDQSACFMAYAK